MAPKGWTSVTVKTSVHEALVALSKKLSDELGTDVSLSQTIQIVTNFYVDQHKGGEEPG